MLYLYSANIRTLFYIVYCFMNYFSLFINNSLVHLHNQPKAVLLFIILLF